LLDKLTLKLVEVRGDISIITVRCDLPDTSGVDLALENSINIDTRNMDLFRLDFSRLDKLLDLGNAALYSSIGGSRQSIIRLNVSQISNRT
jgi:hypothetical protein